MRITTLTQTHESSINQRGLEGRFDIDMFSLMGMEVDNDIDQDDGDEETEKRCKMLRTYKFLSDYS